MPGLTRVPVPVPALLLIAAALVATFVPGTGDLSIAADQRIVTVALIVILFDGGTGIGWPRMRPNAGAVLWIGIAGTLVTAAALAAAAHLLFGFDWRAGLVIGAALAPTDPAVVFSVLGDRAIQGRSGTLLEGESGANDPVGIALMVSLLSAGDHSGWAAFGHGIGLFALQLGVGAVFGIVGGWSLRTLAVRLPMPALLRTIALLGAAMLLYLATASIDGSGFLAVFVAGILVGDAAAPADDRTARAAAAVPGMAEVVAFVVLGLSVDLGTVFSGDRAWLALGLAALLILVVRPVLVGAVLWPVSLPRGERAFVLLAGLKGAVPILLGTYALARHVPRAGEIYDIVFVVVLISVVVQGSLVPSLTRVLHVPMRADPSTQ